jgi:D-sedoheptulose 7-phosphate isomerase
MEEALKVIKESIAIKEKLKIEVVYIVKASEVILAALKGGNKVLLCGNGGSAADAQHIAGELVHKLAKRRKSLPAIALTTNTSLLTAISNDDSYNEVFSRQIEGIGRPGDVLVAISTSGNSPNVISAVTQAKALGMKTVGLCGSGGRLKDMVDIAIGVPSTNTQRIQECHILIGHIISEVVEDAFS